MTMTVAPGAMIYSAPEALNFKSNSQNIITLFLFWYFVGHSLDFCKRLISSTHMTTTVAPGAMIYSAPEELTSNQTVKLLV